MDQKQHNGPIVWEQWKFQKCSDQAEISRGDQFLTKDYEYHGPEGEK